MPTPGDLTPIVIPIVVAAISFLAAILAVVVGQLLTSRFQRSSDERRWGREDALRRRTRSEEMAREAMERLAKASDEVGWTAGYARGAAQGKSQRTYVEPQLDDVSALVRPVRRAALEVDDPFVRDHLDKSCDVLVNGSAARSMGAPHPARTAWAVQQTTESLISAYLRFEPLPVPPNVTPDQDRPWKVFNQAYAALEDLWAEYDDEEEN